MDKLNVITLKFKHSSNKDKLNNFKDHVILEIFDAYFIDDIDLMSLTKMKKLINAYVKNKNTKNKVLRCLSIEHYLMREWNDSKAEALEKCMNFLN